MCWLEPSGSSEEMIATHKRLVANKKRYQERGDRFMAERYQEDIDYLARTAKAFGITLDDEPAFKVQTPRVEVAKPVAAEKLGFDGPHEFSWGDSIPWPPEADLR